MFSKAAKTTDNSVSVYPHLEFWLSSADMAERLRRIDAAIATTPVKDIPRLWDGIPFDVFSLLAFHRPPQYPNLLRFFPDWPSTRVMEETVGASGLKLQMMTNAFIRSLVGGATRFLPRPLASCHVLDYGVGFGRNLRMLSKYVPTDQLAGIDPFSPHIDSCKTIGLKAQTCLCETVPTGLPEPLAGRRFDLVFLFSIFTHLSEATHKRVLGVIHNALADDGLLAVTVRPGEAWDVTAKREEIPRYRKLHDDTGFAFMPIAIFPPVNGEHTFGETTISLDYVRREWTDWELVGTDLNLIDPYQLILFLRKKNAARV